MILYDSDRNFTIGPEYRGRVVNMSQESLHFTLINLAETDSGEYISNCTDPTEKVILQVIRMYRKQRNIYDIITNVIPTYFRLFMTLSDALWLYQRILNYYIKRYCITVSNGPYYFVRSNCIINSMTIRRNNITILDATIWLY